MKELLCPTCNEPYNKDEWSICSNPFHCCKDCEWVVEDHGVYTTGKLIKFCDFHKGIEFRPPV